MDIIFLALTSSKRAPILCRGKTIDLRLILVMCGTNFCDLKNSKTFCLLICSEMGPVQDSGVICAAYQNIDHWSGVISAVYKSIDRWSTEPHRTRPMKWTSKPLSSGKCLTVVSNWTLSFYRIFKSPFN